LKFFQDLGLTLRERWRRANFDSRAFPDLAATALTERPPSANVDPMDVVRWVHETDALVPQADIHHKFGQPPITVFRCEEFHIDVLFWVDGTTTRHQHGFSGAFHVMDGASLESRYSFTAERRYSERLMRGRLELSGAALHGKGDVESIHAGTGFVHALFHLDRPSVSVVIRTFGDELAGPQYNYLTGGIAIDPFATSESLARKIHTLDLLREIGSAELEPLARATIRADDAFTACKLLLHLGPRMTPHDRYLAFLDSIRPAHDDLIDALALHATEDRRVRHISTHRRRVTKAEHRFFLALLMNLPSRGPILEMVRSAFPDHPPVDTVLRWVDELAKLDAIQAWVIERRESATDTTIDVPLDGAALRVLRHSLEGSPGEGGDAADALERSLLLAPLLR
jgi:hypothetical protein